MTTNLKSNYVQGAFFRMSPIKSNRNGTFSKVVNTVEKETQSSTTQPSITGSPEVVLTPFKVQEGKLSMTYYVDKDNTYYTNTMDPIQRGTPLYEEVNDAYVKQIEEEKAKKGTKPVVTTDTEENIPPNVPPSTPEDYQVSGKIDLDST
jgi:hypothetical protein